MPPEEEPYICPGCTAIGAKPLQVKADLPDKGWDQPHPLCLVRDFGSSSSAKIASFSLIGTLIRTISGSPQPLDKDDWELFHHRVPEIVQALERDGFKLVLFVNQPLPPGLKSKQVSDFKKKIDRLLDALEVPMLIMISTSKGSEFHKPSTGMWQLMLNSFNGGVAPDLEASFYVGNIAGRASDSVDPISNLPASFDKAFAAQVGIQFKLPEELFFDIASRSAHQVVRRGQLVDAQGASSQGRGG
jgi:bifunctional polynucleotide phosphatase/kinase